MFAERNAFIVKGFKRVAPVLMLGGLCAQPANAGSGDPGERGFPSGDESSKYSSSLFLGTYRPADLSDMEPRPLVVLSGEEPAIGREVLLHTPGVSPRTGTVRRWGEFQFLQEHDVIPCGFLEVESGEPDLPSYFPVTPASPALQGSRIVETRNSLAGRIRRELEKISLKRVMEKMAKPRHESDRKWNAEELARKSFIEEHAYRRFLLPTNQDLVFLATKAVDVPLEPGQIHIYHTAYHRHEVMGFILSPEGSIDQVYPDVGSLSWAGGDGTSYLKRWSPGEFLEKLVLGVYDVEPDGALEIIMGRVGAEAEYVTVKRFHDGTITETDVAIEGGL